MVHIWLIYGSYTVNIWLIYIYIIIYTLWYFCNIWCITTNWYIIPGTFTISGWWLTYPSGKYDFVSWDDDIPNIWKNNPNVPNHQPDIYIYIPSGNLT